MVDYLASNSVQAATNWQYLGGSAGYNPANGQPVGMVDKSSIMPANLLATVLTRLPEGQTIGNNPAALAQLTADAGANVFLKADANVKISYISEGAGYLNSVGFFKFPKASLTTLSATSVVDTIIFPNFSDNVLQFGKTVDLGNFVAGDAIGFTIVANGWVPYVAATHGVSASGGIVDPNKAVSKIFRTIKRFNPEPADTNNLQAHTILFAYPEKELMVLAFEDLNRQSGSLNDYGYTSDNDFNDVVIAIHVTPFSAVDCTNCNLLVQTPSCKTPITTVPIPDAALTNNGRKVNICHFTSSATNPWNFINISANALDTHLNHHHDVFQVNGACPPVSAGICPTTPTCTAPQILDSATNTCITPPPGTPDCTAPQVLDSATNTCVTPEPPTCTAPQVLDATTNTCKSPTPLPPVIGDSGPISWREITVPKEVDDPNRTAKAAAKAAKIKAANGNGNSTDTGNSTTTAP